MSKITPKTYYKCDICGQEADRHFKVKIPVSGTNLKKWERLDMCYYCYSEFLDTCKLQKDKKMRKVDNDDNDFCEWTISMLNSRRKIRKNCMFAEDTVDPWKFEFCPYCGKRIKIIESGKED